MSHPSFIAADSLAADARRIARELKEFRENDPDGYAKYIEEVRQRSYRLTGRNPDGTRK